MMRAFVVWMPPINYSTSSNIYQSHYNCDKCSAEILPSMVMAIDGGDVYNVGKDNKYIYNIRCLSCEFKYDRNFHEAVTEMVRKELRKIIKEEIHDPKGPFSPDDEF